MKPKGRYRGNEQREKLHKFMVSVKNYVKSKGGEEDSERFEKMGSLMKRKSRKDLRREKRKAKKQRNLGRSSGNTEGSDGAGPQSQINKKSILKAKAGGGDAAGGKTRVQSKDPESKRKAEKPANEKTKRKVHFDDAETQETKKAKLDMARRRALLEANEAEDKVIKKLEKHLHLNKRKNKRTLPQSFINDGLDYILGILEPGGFGALLEEGGEDDDDDDDDEEEGGLRAEKMKSKLERLKEISDSEEELEEEEEEEDDEGDGAEEGNSGAERVLDGVTEEENEDNEDGGDGDEIEEEDDEGDEEVQEEMEETMEEEEEDNNDDDEEEGDGEEEEPESSTNSEKPSTSTAGKYVPPQLREAADSKRKAELERLRRSLKGLINRLSEANMASISGQVEEMYMSCSRKDMNDTLTDLLLAACVTPALMPDRLLMEHVLLLSVLHHTVGLEVGAHFLETVVRQFDETYRLQSSDVGKECDNLVSIIAHLYNFHVVHSLLLFDVLRRLLGSFTARDVELVLLMLRNVGFALRKDDPLALKELITEAQRKASTEGQRFSDQTRVRFMLETMLALKNNDMRKIPGYDPEPVERLRKLQRTLIHSRASGTDVKLRVSLENLLEAERVGRWWIVGSSWSGAPMISDQDNKTPSQPVRGEQFSTKVLDLARKQRMNTDVRRNIFCVIMTSEDYMDAFEKLLRLGLKGQQERDIVHVLLDCCLQEKSFNGFYAVLSEKFCTHDRRFQMTFQFCLWDKFKELASLSSSSFSNLVQMVIHLIHKNSLSLSILKAIEFGELDKPKVKFLRQVLSKLLQQTQPEELVQMFGRISGFPKLEMLREGLKLFIRHFLLRSAPTPGSAERTTLLTERAEIAIKSMEARDSKLKL